MQAFTHSLLMKDHDIIDSVVKVLGG